MVQIVTVDLYLTASALHVCENHGINVAQIARDAVLSEIRSREDINTTILKL